jgi:hypothetical protein
MSSPIYGLVAEFDKVDDLIAATRAVHEQGYRNVDAFTPFPVEEVAEELHLGGTGVPPLVLGAGLTGAAGGFLLQTIGMAYDYPMNVGGRPLVSWPAFIPITFESTILLAAFAAVLGILVLNGLPRPHHPVFNTPNFERASDDGFFLCIEATDRKFDLANTRRFLESLKAKRVSEVEK